MRAAYIAATRKEARALLPVWVAAAVTILADPLIQGTPLHALFPVGPFGYILGSLALGAHAIGHEYSNRTLGSLFAQPWRRSSILIIKAMVLAMMLAGLALLAWPLLFVGSGRMFAGVSRYTALFLPVAGGLLVAPFVTMRLRSQIAGIVFTAAIPGSVYLLALLVGVILHGVQSDAAEALAWSQWLRAMFVFAAAGAVLSARAFMRLEDVEGGREELRLPAWLAATDRNPIRPPLWMLVKKELRLQQMTFAMPAVFAGIWVALTMAGRANPEFAKGFPIRGVGLLYFALLPLLIGSLASAQEREFGMIETQAMLPVPFAHQWSVKAGVVFALALVLGTVMPWFVFAPPELSRDALWPLTTGILVLTAWSLYLSSWSPSGIIALALVLPATAAGIVVLRWIDSVMESFAPGHTPKSPDSMMFAELLVPLAVTLVFFAGGNHRMRERRVRRLMFQAVCLIAVFIVTDIVVTTLL